MVEKENIKATSLPTPAPIPHFHPFRAPVESIPVPEQFTYPFHYTPHPLCVRAAGEVQAYLALRTDWADEVGKGKMFGVLAVRTREGKVGFLAAFSGILAGSNRHDYFVPPVYDLLQPGGFFKLEEQQISAINRRIEALRQGEAYRTACLSWRDSERQAEAELEKSRQSLRQARDRRQAVRGQAADPDTWEALARESQHQKAEHRRLEQRWKERVAAAKGKVGALDAQVALWKDERKERSAALQRKLFGQFRLRNARGGQKDLVAIFAEARGELPPAGAGECAAPKLLQYAYEQGLEPLAMAEFWWGASPRNEVRHQGFYYPSCKSKCEPILNFMLQGLDVEPDPLACQARSSVDVRVVYEDDALLVVDKPAGMLSVPGKDAGAPSVLGWAMAHCPKAGGPLVVHRLDMATSGLLLLAKTKTVHRQLQLQFEGRTVKKRYVALLEGRVGADRGFIRLPLCPDLADRPRQMVSEAYGKPAVTRYEVLALEGGRTRIAFYPLTGRTHQLRVHAAHAAGLGTPIVGDTLYGHPADRLYLHAQRLEFRHPLTGEMLRLEAGVPF